MQRTNMSIASDVRREGLFFSGLSLAGKAAVGLGGFLAGVALDTIGFQAASTATAVSAAELRAQSRARCRSPSRR
jgi:Na+/melibiose symporter-like transporter